MVVDEAGLLVGIFTDSDLARLLEANRDAAIDGPLADVMTRSPATVTTGELPIGRLRSAFAPQNQRTSGR